MREIPTHSFLGMLNLSRGQGDVNLEKSIKIYSATVTFFGSSFVFCKRAISKVKRYLKAT